MSGEQRFSRYQQTSATAAAMLALGESGRFEFKRGSDEIKPGVLAALANAVALDAERDVAHLLVGVDEIEDKATGLVRGVPVGLPISEAVTWPPALRPPTGPRHLVHPTPTIKGPPTCPCCDRRDVRIPIRTGNYDLCAPGRQPVFETQSARRARAAAKRSCQANGASACAVVAKAPSQAR